MTNRPYTLVLWLAATSAAAAPLAGGEEDQRPGFGHLMTPAEHTPETLGHTTGTDAREDIIMRRLRLIIDQRKQAGPPPVGCMEG